MRNSYFFEDHRPNWETKKVKDVAVVNEENISSSDHYDVIEYIEISIVNQGEISDIPIINFDMAPSRAKRKVKQNDILLSTVRPNLEHYAFIKTANSYTIASTGFAVITAKDIKPRFLYYVLTSQNYTDYFSMIAEGHTSAYPAMNPDVIENVEIPVPPKEEQKRIAHILGTLDDKIELNQRMNQTLEAIARAIFKSWFVDFDPVRAKMAGETYPLPDQIMALFPDQLMESELGMIPKGWEVTKFGKLCKKPQYGFTESATDDDTGVKFLRITDINKKPWVDWSTVPFCKIGDEDFQKYKVNFGDLLIARIADPGHSTFIENDINAVFASYLIRFIPKNNKYQRYLQYWMRSKPYWNLVQSRMTGSTRSNLNATVLKGFEIIHPTTDLIEIFDNIISSLREIINYHVLEIKSLREIREILINENFIKGAKNHEFQ